MGFTLTIRRNIIPQVKVSITDKSESAVRDNAHYVQSYAQAIAPVLTGAFRQSIYVNGPAGESDYAEAAGNASQLNPNANIVPELQAAIVDPSANRLRDPDTGRFTVSQAIASSAVEYSLYLEEGTVHMAPRPTFRLAVLAAEVPFVQAMSGVAGGF